MSVGGSSNDRGGSPYFAGTDGLVDRQKLLAELSRMVTERFERITGLTAALGAVDVAALRPEDAFSAPPTHPLCADSPDTEYCRHSWRSHLAELALRLQVSWHKCRFGKLCAMVPVTWHRQCVAVCRLVCPESMGQDAFEHNVELLAVLTENFVARHGGGLPPHALAGVTETAPMPPLDAPSGAGDARPLAHPKVTVAVEYIHEHLRDTDLNAAQIALHLGMNATYLAHLFTDQTGLRMNRYIAIQRVEMARKLLAVTNWQIKRIARECGYANPDWFGHVFHALVGVTPSEYRQKLHGSGPAPASA